MVFREGRERERERERERYRYEMGGFGVLGRERRGKVRNEKGDGARERHEAGGGCVYFQFLFPLFFIIVRS